MYFAVSWGKVIPPNWMDRSLHRLQNWFCIPWSLLTSNLYQTALANCKINVDFKCSGLVKKRSSFSYPQSFELILKTRHLVSRCGLTLEVVFEMFCDGSKYHASDNRVQRRGSNNKISCALQQGALQCAAEVPDGWDSGCFLRARGCPYHIWHLSSQRT